MTALLAQRPRALVLGATGHIGQAIVRDLLAHGYRVTAATRRAAPAGLADLAVDVAVGDADRPGQLDAWVRDHDVVVDAAAPYPIHRFSPQGPSEVDPMAHAQTRTAALLRAVAGSGARLVYVGSFTTLPRREDPLAALETMWRRQSHPYFAVKQLIESMLLDASRRGVPIVLVNPTAFLGPWDDKPRQLSLIPQLLDGLVPVTVGRVVNVVDVRDAAAMIRRLLETEVFGTPIPITGHDVPADLLVARICELAQVRPPRLRVSARLSATSAHWIEAAWALGDKPSPLPSLPLLLVCDTQAMGPPSTALRLGTTVRALDETLRDAIAWYRLRTDH